MIWKFATGAMQAYNFLEGLETQRRAREQEERVIRSMEEAERTRRFIENPQASGLLGDGRLGNIHDAATEGMLDPQGLFLGALQGQPIFYPGDAHLLNYGLTRSGKGRDIILPNLAHALNRDRTDGKGLAQDAPAPKQEECSLKGGTPFIPSRKGRKTPIPHDTDRQKKRHKIKN